MLKKRTVKPHRIKWIEAERELATRGVFPPSCSIGYEYFPIDDEYRLPHPNKVLDPKKKG